MNIDDLKESTEALREHTPETADEMSDVCAEIHAAMDFQDAVKAQEVAACAELVAQLEAVRAPFRAQHAAALELIAAAKASLTRRIEADELAMLEAIAAQRQVPAPTVLPKGLRSTRKTVLTGVELEQLPAEYLTMVADADRILRAAEAGETVPGATVETEFGVVYTRPKGSKKTK